MTKHILFLKAVLISVFLFSCAVQKEIPASFVDLKTSIPNMEIDLRYHGSHNFLGRPVDGYDAVRVYITKEAATAMMAIQKELNSKGFGIKVFDAYRPQKAVNNFKAWALDIADTLAKQEFYPNVDKRDLFKLGYIAEKSGHSRGSTIDLTIIKLDDKTELDMGTGFDFFGEPSHHDYKNLTEEQRNNRKVLRNIMEKHGFKAIEEEWWHYTLKNEPFKDQYFDFDVK
ncbi:M15 family metallopeptidase [Sphingobacterium daejeonense]|uniref:M15 family metallopeptidase n=1 Tax=Sphingobacterium daejeonense TaxID=371142 RepID=UPI0010C2C85D|nr:M15 family metallopeptidase [Sphingobacterium daejeonense]MCT1532074.1 M15 family metallopeptidase [Sphingobacterium daejeonense]VTQ03360.1 D-alanyl-D-alanine dipeptidase [Sphingobacterium daejeonense]